MIPSDIVADDPIPSEPPDGLGSHLSSLAGDRFEGDSGISPVSTPSEPSRLSSRLSSSADNFFKNDHGIKPGSAHDLIEQSVTKLEIGQLCGFDTFHDKGVGTTSGEQYKKIQAHFVDACKHDRILSVWFVGECQDFHMDAHAHVIGTLLGIGVCVTNLAIELYRGRLVEVIVELGLYKSQEHDMTIRSVISL